LYEKTFQEFFKSPFPSDPPSSICEIISFILCNGSNGVVCVRQHKLLGIPIEDETPSVTTHTTRSKINTLMFLRGKTPMWGNIHNPNQHGHLRQFINAKENILQESFSQSIIEK
jgi:hypothetical protein